MMSNPEGCKHEDQVRAESLSELCMRLGEKSIDMVEQRYQSLLSTSSHLMTCISIIFVALFSLLPVLLLQCPALIRVIAIGYFVISSLLVAALITTLIARYRFQYSITQSPEKLADYAVQHRNEFADEAEVGQFFGRCLQEPYESMQARNDRISLLIKASFYLLIACLLLALLFSGFLLLTQALCL